MFVSPPPASTKGQGLGRRRNSALSSGIANGGVLQSIPEGSMTNALAQEQPMYQPLQGQQQSTILPLPLKKEATNFVNAPPEYADRARDEIRKRLLHSQSSSVPSSHSSQSSIRSHRSRSSSTHDNRSVISDNASSIFSEPATLYTQSTRQSSILQTPKEIVTQVTLEDALPKNFFDMYPPEILLADPSSLLCNGRPKFTERELLDWELNDIRSLLIVEKLQPEWGNQLPLIVTNHSNLPNFRFQLLPLSSSDDFIIETLVNSDLYLEANLDFQFKLTSAKYTVTSARKRHEHMTGESEAIMHLSKPEWRNIIENYLLNIAVEAQCRFDFKHRCSEFKKFKLQQQQQSNLKKPDMPPPRFIPANQARKSSGSASLLKRTLMKNLQLNNFNKNQDFNNDNSDNDNTSSFSTGSNQTIGKVSLTKEEKAMLWSHCQAQVYQRLGLDWQPDGVSRM